MQHLQIMTVRPEVEQIIASTIGEAMQPFGFRAAIVRPGEDHAGDPALFIEVQYDPSDTPIDFSVTSSLTTIVRDKLWEQGERRFPYIRHKFDERQPLQKLGPIRRRRGKI